MQSRLYIRLTFGLTHFKQNPRRITNCIIIYSFFWSDSSTSDFVCLSVHNKFLFLPCGFSFLPFPLIRLPLYAPTPYPACFNHPPFNSSFSVVLIIRVNIHFSLTVVYRIQKNTISKKLPLLQAPSPFPAHSYPYTPKLLFSYSKKGKPQKKILH